MSSKTSQILFWQKCTLWLWKRLECNAMTLTVPLDLDKYFFHICGMVLEMQIASIPWNEQRQMYRDIYFT